jgi:hypothetical protein
VSEQTVTLFPDEAVELARIIDVFLEYAARPNDYLIADLADIAYGDHIPGYVDWIEESLVWAGRLALRMRQQAADATAATTTNGDQQ